MGKRKVLDDGTVRIEHKNENGEASIYQRKSDGKWCTAIVLPNGKRRVLYGKSREEVREKLKQDRANIVKGLPLPAARDTVRSFLSRWLTDVAPKKIRQTTLARYRLDIDRRLIPGIGSIKLHEFAVADVNRFLSDLTKNGLGPRSVGHCRAVLRSALSQAQREGLIGQNVAKLATIPRYEPKPVEALTPADAKAILDAFAGHDYEALITLALATGLRQGELLGLAWDDVNLDDGAITIRRQLQRIANRYELTDTKTRQSRRSLALPAIAVEALRKHRTQQAERRLLLGPAWKDSGRVFTTTLGDYLNGTVVSHRFRTHVVAAGLTSRHFHELRHGAASLLLAQGASLRTVMEQLGHSTITLTANTYSHISPQLLRDAADKLNDALGGTG